MEEMREGEVHEAGRGPPCKALLKLRLGGRNSSSGQRAWSALATLARAILVVGWGLKWLVSEWETWGRVEQRPCRAAHCRERLGRVCCWAEFTCSIK